MLLRPEQPHRQTITNQVARAGNMVASVLIQGSCISPYSDDGELHRIAVEDGGGQSIKWNATAYVQHMGDKCENYRQLTTVIVAILLRSED